MLLIPTDFSTSFFFEDALPSPGTRHWPVTAHNQTTIAVALLDTEIPETLLCFKHSGIIVRL